jgi:hypothetical protein
VCSSSSISHFAAIRIRSRWAHDDVAELRLGEQQEVVVAAPPDDERRDHPPFAVSNIASQDGAASTSFETIRCR